MFGPLDARVEDIYSRCGQALRTAEGPASMVAAYAGLGHDLFQMISITGRGAALSAGAPRR